MFGNFISGYTGNTGSIILNAIENNISSVFSTSIAGVFVAPINNVVQTSLLNYNVDTNEINTSPYLSLESVSNTVPTLGIYKVSDKKIGFNTSSTQRFSVGESNSEFINAVSQKNQPYYDYTFINTSGSYSIPYSNSPYIYIVNNTLINITLPSLNNTSDGSAYRIICNYAATLQTGDIPGNNIYLLDGTTLSLNNLISLSLGCVYNLYAVKDSSVIPSPGYWYVYQIRNFDP